MKLLLSIILLFVNLAFLSAQEESLSPNSQKPVIESIVVGVNGEVSLAWSVVDTTDITGFDVLRWENPSFLLVQPIPFDPNNPDMTFSYFPGNYNPCAERAIYSVRPVIPGANTTQSEAFSTILIEIEDYQVCDRKATITWSALSTTLGNDDDLNSRYKIFVEDLGTPGYQEIANFERNSLTAVRDESYYQIGQLRINFYSYEHTGLNPGSTYRYYVEASSDVEGWTSISCPKQITADDYPTPEFYNLLSVSVTPTGRVELTVELDLSAFLLDVLVFRSQQPVNLAALGEFNMPTATLAYLFDSTALTNQSAYYYQFGVNDSCDYELRGSGIHRTIFLEGDLTNPDEPSLAWNAYEGWDVLNYHIYRKLANEANFQIIGTVGPAVLIYNDDISALDNRSGSIIYYIRAEADTASTTGMEFFSNSNQLTVAYEANPSIAFNAFNPLSRFGNDIFKPTALYFGPDRPYLFQIYNRWGELVFESTDFNNGWDGRYKGDLVPKGVYVYMLNYTDTEGFDVNERGTVMVVY